MQSRTRDLKAEKAWREDYRKEFGRLPSAAELNIAVYGEQMPAFTLPKVEMLRLRARSFISRLPLADVKDIAKYAAGVTLGILIVEAIHALL